MITYAAVGMAIPHQFSVGGLFAEGTWQHGYWAGLCSTTGLALLCFRVALPLVATYRHQLRVVRVEAVAPGVVSIVMKGRALDKLSGAGGRFFIWRFLAPGMWWHPHPFSLSAEPVVHATDGIGTLRITVRNLGSGSAQLIRLHAGTRVAVAGPYGLFGTAARTRDKVVLIGAGIGITPCGRSSKRRHSPRAKLPSYCAATASRSYTSAAKSSHSVGSAVRDSST
ncbi:hypothetical protein [Arthrobacter ulcerisalmonis]|uniref:hypothetical protein n=1 Tax=Arthrobacter ulcerisalmonis TaxID=2483813 RepID=UPI0036293449